MKIPSLISPVILAVGMVRLPDRGPCSGRPISPLQHGGVPVREMFAPPDQSGFAAGLAYTRIDINKATGNGHLETGLEPIAGFDRNGASLGRVSPSPLGIV